MISIEPAVQLYAVTSYHALITPAKYVLLLVILMVGNLAIVAKIQRVLSLFDYTCS